MKILQDLSLTELKRELEIIVDKMPRYRAEQVYKWANDYVSFDEMNNIPKELREKLKENFNYTSRIFTSFRRCFLRWQQRRLR